MKRFLETHPDYPRDRYGEVRNQRVTELLTRSVYAGYVESPAWDVSLRKGHHEALISFETHQTIQDRLNGKPRVPARKDLNLDFPLRGAVVCGHCSTPLTACWSSGRVARYPYYLCPRRGCESYGKSIRRDLLESECETMLRTLQPSEALFRVASAMFRDLWKHRMESGVARAQSLKADLAALERQVEQFLNRIADTNVSSVITVYGNRIRKLEAQKIVVSKAIAKCGRPVRSFDESRRTALEFLGDPWELWVSGEIEH